MKTVQRFLCPFLKYTNQTKFIILSFFVLSIQQTGYAQNYGAGQRIHYYVQDGTLVTGGSLTSINWNRVTHVIYSFLNPMDNTGSLYLTAGQPGGTAGSSVWFTTSRFTNFLTTVRAANPNIKIFISMGGAPTSSDAGITTRLNTIFASGAASTTLINNIGTFVETNNLDGFDLDLEHPVTATELTNHANFLAALRTRLNTAQVNICKRIELAIALNGDCNKFAVNPAGQDYVLPSVINSIDVVHLMTYDASSTNVSYYGGTVFNSHAPLQMARDAVTAFSSPPFNWPLNKMVIGIPFYGRNSVGGATTNVYSAINATNTSTIFNADVSGGFNYNGCVTITNKVNYARNNGLMGVLVWEGTQDLYTGANSLLGCIYTATGLTAIPAIQRTCCSKVNLGNDLITCNTPFPITLNSGTSTNTNVTFTWTRIAPSLSTLTSSSASANTQVVTSANGAGTYVVRRDSSLASGGFCSTYDTIVISSSVSLPTPDLTPTPRSLCTRGSYTLTPNNARAFPPGTIYQWQLNAGNIAGATSNSLYANSAGTYTLVASLTGCTGTSANVVLNGTRAVGVDACRTTTGTLNLSVTGGTGPFNWYAGDVPNNTLLQANSSTYTTPSLPLPSDMVYYVDDIGASSNTAVGAVGPPATSPFYNALFSTDPVNNVDPSGDIAQEFQVTGPVKITSVDVFPWGGSSFGTAVIRVQIYNMNGPNGTGIVYTSPNFTFTAGSHPTPVTLNLDANLTGSATNPGYYRMRVFVVTNVSPNRIAFGHNNSTQPVTYPLGTGNLRITNQRGTPSFGPFYNWQVRDMGGCGRIPVRAQVAASCSVALPVTFANFEAGLMPDRTALLTWATVEEINNSHFTIERSTDMVNFFSIARVEGGSHAKIVREYEYIDNQVPAGRVYYRLAQTDFDGTVQYSEVKAIENLDLSLQIMPNPFSNSTTLTIGGVQSSSIDVRVYEITGMEVFRSSNHKINDQIELGSTFKSGIYLVTVQTSQASKTYKIIKQ